MNNSEKFHLMNLQAAETHTFSPFVPPNARILILGSFPGKEQTQKQTVPEQWFYGSPRNQFWKILSSVFHTPLFTRSEKQKLFSEQGIGITDILLKIRRKENTNADEQLEILEYNYFVIREILEQHPQILVLFTSRFAGMHFQKLFSKYPHTDYLPSPSPRFARMKLEEKISIYAEKLQ